MKKILIGLLAVLPGWCSFAAALTGADGVSVEITSRPVRIVALNPSTIEILRALGEAERIVGVDRAGVALLPEREDLADLGHPYSPSVEGIISLKPDLVIGTADSLQKASADQLRSARVPVLVLEPSAQDGLEGLKRRVRAVAAVFDKTERGGAINQEIDRRRAALQARTARIEKKRRVFFLYTHGPGHAAIYGRETGSHWLIDLAGGVNAADFTVGTKPLNAEAMVRADPDALILLQRGIDAVKGVPGALKLPGVSLTKAGKAKAVFVVDNNIRWIGPRFLDHAEKLFGELYPEPTTAPVP